MYKYICILCEYIMYLIYQPFNLAHIGNLILRGICAFTGMKTTMLRSGRNSFIASK